MKFHKFFKRHTLIANQVIIKDNEMAITEVQRLELADKAREVFDEQADVFMAHLPMGGAGQVVTKEYLNKELLQLRLEMRNSFNRQTYSLITANATVCVLILAIFKWG